MRLLSFLFAATLTQLGAADEVTDGEKLFALRIRTLFADKCVSCHGGDPDDIASGFDMRSRAALLRGGENFPDDVVVPRQGRRSMLYRAVLRVEEGMEMPPKAAEKLTTEESNWVRLWIDEGAPWPSEERVAEIRSRYAEGELVQTSRGLSDDWTNRRYEKQNLWAYQPLDVQQPPEGQHPVDWFINRKLKAAGLTPAPAAEPRDLARRLSFGLTGLPPSGVGGTRRAQSFEQAYRSNPGAAVLNYAKELMASPHYGEHFGLHWLDVSRYADSAGFANDFARPNAWRYRDYVVRAFNSDKPYNEFVREQIAGDEIDEEDVEKRIATGFLRMGPWEQTAMSVFRVTRVQWLDDVTDAVGQAFLGHALQCARCHDHKFDPVPTRDYYGMMAVFSTTQFAEPEAPFLPNENRIGFTAANEWTRAKLAAYKQDRQEVQARINENRKKETGDAKVGDNGLDPGDEASLARINKNASRHTWELDRTRPIALAVYTGKTVQRNHVANRLPQPHDPWGKGFVEQDTILSGGDPYARGDSVVPGPLSAASNLGNMNVVEFPGGQGKRRLALANWIVDSRNPLTARVMVNRVWSWHFGKGIAGNPNNFGATGELPTHPQLLDYLADWFMQHDWSVRQLNELILTSEAWRRSSRHPDPGAVKERDPNQHLYAFFQPRRLTAEEFRDAMLATSGELNRQVGGIPCRPDMHLEVANQPRQIMGGTASVYEPDPLPRQRNRRTLYAEKTRGLRDPFLETFNQPGPDKSCELRETSTVAPQALTLLNTPEVQDRSLAFANRLMEIGLHDDAVIRRAFEISLARPPSNSELQACLQHWAASTLEEVGKTYEQVAWTVKIERTVMAEKTGEPYSFVETRPAYRSYVPDLQPSQVSARVRGLAHVCLVLFNANEFAWLD